MSFSNYNLPRFGQEDEAQRIYLASVLGDIYDRLATFSTSGAPADDKYITWDTPQAALTNAKKLVAGSNITVTVGASTVTIGGAASGVTDVTASSPLSSTGGATPDISIQNATADGVTKGAAAFAAADFNSASGVISLDYTNGQAADATHKGYLTSADWTTFNKKVGVITAGAQWEASQAIAVVNTKPVDRSIPLTGTITAVTVLTYGGTGSCVVDIAKSTYGAFPPSSSICASAKPTISSGTKYVDTTLTGWTTTVTAEDVLRFSLQSNSVFTRVAVFLEITP